MPNWWLQNSVKCKIMQCGWPDWLGWPDLSFPWNAMNSEYNPHQEKLLRSLCFMKIRQSNKCIFKLILSSSNRMNFGYSPHEWCCALREQCQHLLWSFLFTSLDGCYKNSNPSLPPSLLCRLPQNHTFGQKLWRKGNAFHDWFLKFISASLSFNFLVRNIGFQRL